MDSSTPKEKLYEEVGSNYRYFLSWRHAAFVGQLLVLYGVVSLTITVYEKVPRLSWVVPLAAFPVGILLWAINVRTRELYHAAIRAGHHLEGDQSGFYTRLANEVALPAGTSPFQKITQTAVLNVFFIGSALLLLVSAAILFTCRPSQATSQGNPGPPPAATKP